MSSSLLVDYGSVLRAAESVAGISRLLGDANGDAALHTVAGCLPGGELAASADQEAREWQREMGELGATLRRYAAALATAVEVYRSQDDRLARQGGS